MEEKQVAFQMANPKRNITSADLHRLAVDFPFPAPVLPGDDSLIPDFVADIAIQLKQEGIGLENSDLALHLSVLLFRLVIVRTYLARPPENDMDIFDLVVNGQVTRIWTAHELALAACCGEEDTTAHAVFAIAPDPAIWKADVVLDEELTVPDDEPLVSVNATPPTVWTTRPGLCGGSRVPRRYRPPHLRVTQPVPRPQPRPAYRITRASSRTPETSKAASEKGKRAISEVDAVEIPSRTSPGMGVPVRRSGRTRAMAERKV